MTLGSQVFQQKAMMLFMISTVTSSLFCCYCKFKKIQSFVLDNLRSLHLVTYSSGREAEEVEPIIGALPKLEQ